MLKSLKPKSDFTKNVLTLMTGTTIAQAIPISISPIISRIYTPEDFGILTTLLAITSIIGAIASGRYEQAIMLPKKDEDAINILALGLLIVSSLSIFITLTIVFFHSSLLALLDNQKIGFWLYFVPLIILITGLFNLLNYYNNRKQYYKDIAKANILRSIVLGSLQLLIGFVKSGAIGLITGQMFSEIFANIRLSKNIVSNKILLSKINRHQIIAMAKKYNRFPKYDIWSNLLNVSATQVPILFIGNYFSSSVLGLYSFAFKIISRPSAIISSSISQVFYQSSALVKDNRSDFNKIVFDTYKKLLFLSAIPFSILAFYSDYIFGFIFGSEWFISGQYTQLLSPWLFLAFIASPLSTVLLSLEKQNILLIINITLFCLRMLSVIVGGLILKNMTITIIMLSLSGIIVYLLMLIYVFKITNQSISKTFKHSYKYILLILTIGFSRYLVNLFL